MRTLEQAARRKKDPYWWVHPAFKGKQAIGLDDLNTTTDSAFMRTRYKNENTVADPMDDGMPIGQGKFKEFAQLLFKMNDYKPGPVKNWYVVICVEERTKWAVGQLRADPITPVQIFDDLIFDDEAKAREVAESLKT